jgi:5-methylcytosine-specific restriction endonuclease McrA
MKRNWVPFEGEYKVTKLTPDRPICISARESSKFYKSKEWKLCKENFYSSCKDKKCVQCGSTENLNVDHILPVRRFWEKRLLQSNLQILCGKCNKDKCNDVNDLDAVFNRPYLSESPYYSRV